MNHAVQASYDQVPYPGLSHSNTHPDRLATLATLLGMSAAPVERCRVLELGCAVGGNLIPMAYGLPGSQFLGIDASARQIAEGQAAVAALSLENIELRQMDILGVGAELGEFDYILAHGVFSWVPPAVQDGILRICSQNLAPNGVSYVSYNTYPGWHMIDIVRGLMRYHTRNVVDPPSRADEARAILRFLAESCSGENNAYGSFLKMYSEFVDGKLVDDRPRCDATLLHDELEEINQPLYFYQFVERAGDHGLQYLADFHSPMGDSVRPEVAERLMRMAPSLVDLEQYCDFLQNRTFRQTLLCHQEVALSRTLTPGRAKGFYVVSRAKPVSPEPDVQSAAVEEFRGHDGATLSTDHPVSKAAMLCLAQAWPQSLAFDQLLSAARARLEQEGGTPAAGNGDLDAQVLGTNLLKGFGYSQSLVELHVYAPSLAVTAGDCPVASAVACFQAQSAGQVTNLRHERVNLDGLDRFLLQRLDGSRDRVALLELLLAGPVAQGILTLQRAGESPGAAGERELLAEELERRLQGLARAGLLVTPGQTPEVAGKLRAGTASRV